jgi:hypothetical protein
MNTGKRRRGAPAKPAKDMGKIDQKVVFNVLRSFLSQTVAGRLAGYSEKSNDYASKKAYEGTVQEIRERIQGDDRLGFLRQLEFYAELRDDGKVAPSDRIAAAKQLDNVAGYNAPQKVEMNGRQTLIAAVQVVRQVSGMSPIELKRALDERKVAGQALLAQAAPAEVVEVGISREPVSQGVENG